MSADLHACVMACGQQTHRICCVDCSGKVAAMLRDLPELYALSSAEYWPQGGDGGGGSNERSIGLRVDALDGRNPRGAILTLESWERVFREDLDAFGHPDEDKAGYQQRQRKAERWAGSESSDLTGVTLCGVVDFLLTHLDAAATGFMAFDEFAAEVKVIHKHARSAAREGAPPVTVIACPADRETGLCRQELRLDSDHVTCSRCGSEWDRVRLLAVAHGADVETWQPAGMVSEYLGIPASTLSLWARQGHVKRRGTAYEWASVLRYRDRDRETA